MMMMTKICDSMSGGLWAGLGVLDLEGGSGLKQSGGPEVLISQVEVIEL